MWMSVVSSVLRAQDVDQTDAQSSCFSICWYPSLGLHKPTFYCGLSFLKSKFLEISVTESRGTVLLWFMLIIMYLCCSVAYDQSTYHNCAAPYYDLNLQDIFVSQLEYLIECLHYFSTDS